MRAIIIGIFCFSTLTFISTAIVYIWGKDEIMLKIFLTSGVVLLFLLAIITVASKVK